jgi:hypothetical protein
VAQRHNRELKLVATLSVNGYRNGVVHFDCRRLAAVFGIRAYRLYQHAACRVPSSMTERPWGEFKSDQGFRFNQHRRVSDLVTLLVARIGQDDLVRAVLDADQVEVVG